MEDLTLFFIFLTLGVGIVLLITVLYLSLILKATLKADVKKEIIYFSRRIIAVVLAIYFGLAMCIFIILADLFPLCLPY